MGTLQKERGNEMQQKRCSPAHWCCQGRTLGSGEGMKEQFRHSDVSKNAAGKDLKNESHNDFQSLVNIITRIHDELAKQATHAVNTSLTLRNWMIGMHIAEYELNGKDRSNYGDKLFQMLSERLSAGGVSNCNRRQLYRYLDFYRAYPQIVETLSPQFENLLPPGISTYDIVGTVSPQLSFSSKKLFNSLSYSHFELLTGLDNIRYFSIGNKAKGHRFNR